MLSRTNVYSVGLFSVIWSLERFSLTLFNLCLASFLTDAASTGQLMAVMGTIYMVVQTVPLAVLSLYMGVWLDNIERTKAVNRALVIKFVGVLLTLAFSSFMLLFKVKVGLFLMIPVLIFLTTVSAITNCMHLILHISTERIWVVLAAQGHSNSSRFLVKCNSSMSIAHDIGQILGLVVFGALTRHCGDLVFLLSGGLVLVTTLLQYLSYKLAHIKCLPIQIRCVNGEKRSLRMALEEYVSQRDAPVGICWAARSTFTAVWFAATVMQHSPIAVLYKWFYFVTTIATSLSYMCSVPKLRGHVILIVVAVVEIVAIVMAAAPVLATKLQPGASTLNKTTLLDVTEHTVHHTTSISLNEMTPAVYSVATHILLALALVLGATCHRTWNLTALQVFQEGVPARSRGTVGGVQVFLDYTALSFHGALAIAARGTEYVWSCAMIGILLSAFSLIVLVWWRRVRMRNSETVTLLRHAELSVDMPTGQHQGQMM